MNNSVKRYSNYTGEQSHHQQQKQRLLILNTTTTKRTRSSSSTTIVAVVVLSLFGFWIFLWTLMLAVRSVCKKVVEKSQQFPTFTVKQQRAILKNEFQHLTNSTKTI